MRFGDLIASRASCLCDKTAVIYNDKEYSYAEIDANANSVAAFLRANGIGVGNHVVYIAYNSEMYFEILTACSRIGAVFTPISWRMCAESIIELVDATDAKVLFVSKSFLEQLETLKHSISGERKIIVIDDVDEDNAAYSGCLAYPNEEISSADRSGEGCLKAVLVTDRAFGNADTLATSYSILSAANTQDKYDMIFCGKESLDGATGQMGAQLAQRFEAAQVTGTLLIKEVNEEAKTAVVERELEDGVETLEVKLPSLFTMEKVNYPARIPNLKGKLAAKKAVITTITADDIPGLDRGRIGDPGSPTKVPRMFPPVMPEPGIIIDEGSVEASVAKLMQLIKD